MTKNKGYNKMTKEQQQISNHNNELAWQWFEINLNISRHGKVLHHLDTSLKHTNIERYIQWNPFDLVVLSNADHQKMHEHMTKWSKNRIKGRIWSNNGIVEKHDFEIPDGFVEGRLNRK